MEVIADITNYLCQDGDFVIASSAVVWFLLQLTKNTTPMYRAPEMLDLYQNYPVNEQSDIWVNSC